MKKRVTIKNNLSFFSSGHYFYKLMNPFCTIPYIPLSADVLSQNLDLSYSTALRVCKGEKHLKQSEVLLLQIIHFGLIPDKDFIRYKLSFRDGCLHSHDAPNMNLSAGKMAHLYLFETQYVRLQEELREAKALIKKLEKALEPPEPTNIIKFSDYMKKV